ncbi:hypothetical protein [Curtobacterium sp. MCPF17_046]|uniref:hypothetical protein n=1 Tax=Curtobacterium sp. MCPF17_046 TaxID=2175663 RepID=UPI000D8486EA|nr:hypothetical protein [Curtobacterium sp. MCPF17_046]PYY38844.1 hypothetical protein DEJ32_10415 [Curtobacterium sp. MCPF17_046]
MILITTDTGEEITIDRPVGREVNPDVWAMPTGELRSLGRYAIGWRMDAVYYDDDSGIRAVGAYRPENVKGSPFHPAWATCAPEAGCRLGLADMMSNPLRMVGSHSHPHPECTCGHRLMETIGQVSELLQMRGAEYLDQARVYPKPVQTALCISSVVGLGLACAGSDNDPEGTIRTQWLALDEHLLLGQQDAHVADMFNGMDIRVVPDLAALHDA